MTLEEIRALGRRIAVLCEKYGIEELSVFGSVARDDARTSPSTGT
jgi:predicted nucleotidyltransferase